MKIEITIGPVTVLKLVMFEATEELAELECEPCNDNGHMDDDRRLRGDD